MSLSLIPTLHHADSAHPPCPEPAEAPLLEVRGLSVEYTVGARSVTALQQVSLNMRRGETVAVVGESGSGKSTLTRALNGLSAPSARITGGSIWFDGAEITGFGESRLRGLRGTRIGFIPQDPVVGLNPVRTVGAQVVAAVTSHRRLPRVQAWVRAEQLLDDAGIDHVPHRMRQYPHQLSGGLRQRVLIAIGLAGDPELLIADEPTSALDVTVQKRILDHLESVQHRTGVSVLMVTHDLAVAAARADRIVVMSGGRIVEEGPAAELVASPGAAYTRQLVAAVPGAHTALRTPRQESPVPVVEVRELRHRFRVPARRGEPAHEIAAVDGVSFSIGPGETLALVGESGSGKSTTARLTLGLDRVQSGSVVIGGEDTTRLRGHRWRQLRHRVQMIHQNPFASLDPRQSIGRITAEPLAAFGIGNRAQRRRRVGELLDRVALPSTVIDRRPGELSGGQRQRVAIARALTLNPQVLVCDEPVSALDASVQAQVLDLLVQLQEELGLSSLFITHDLAVVRHIAHRVAVMRQGRILETGTVEQIFRAPEHEYTRELLEAAALPAAV